VFIKSLFTRLREITSPDVRTFEAIVIFQFSIDVDSKAEPRLESFQQYLNQMLSEPVFIVLVREWTD